MNKTQETGLIVLIVIATLCINFVTFIGIRSLEFKLNQAEIKVTCKEKE